MNTTGEHPDLPHLESVEADPAYDYAEDIPVDEDDWDAEDEFLDAEEVVVPTPPVKVISASPPNKAAVTIPEDATKTS